MVTTARHRNVQTQMGPFQAESQLNQTWFFIGLWTTVRFQVTMDQRIVPLSTYNDDVCRTQNERQLRISKGLGEVRRQLDIRRLDSRASIHQTI